MAIVFSAFFCLMAQPPVRAEIRGNGVPVELSEANFLMRSGNYGAAAEKIASVLMRRPGNEVAREEMLHLCRLMSANGSNNTNALPVSENERQEMVTLAYKSLRKTSPDKIGKMFLEASSYEKQNMHLLSCRTYLQMLSISGLDLDEKYNVEKKLRKASLRVNSKMESLPENVRGIYREAFTLMNVGDWEGSVGMWYTYSQSQSGDAEVRKLLSFPDSLIVVKGKRKSDEGNLALEAKNPELAKKCFEEALKINPNSQDAVKGLDIVKRQSKREMVSKNVAKAEKMIQADRKFKAIELLSEALKEDPSDSRVLALLQQALDISEQKSTGIVSRVKTTRAQEPEKPDKTIIALRNPEKAEAHYQRGLVYYGLRNFKEALNEWKLAVDFDPTYQKAVRALERVQSDLR